MRATKSDALKLMDSMDSLLTADRNDPAALIGALRRVTVNSTVVGQTDSAQLKDWVITAVDICTAYVQGLIVRKTDEPYRAVVEEYRRKIGELALTEIP